MKAEDDLQLEKMMDALETTSNCAWSQHPGGGTPGDWHDMCPSCLAHAEKHGPSIFRGPPAKWMGGVLNQDWILELLQQRDGIRLSFILEWMVREDELESDMPCEQRRLAYFIRQGLGALARKPGLAAGEKPRAELKAAIARLQWHLKGPVEV
ncbi:MAG: hypothetical protein HYT80_11170 [Euryarchaeota archaeon]|nr:hypothetical protein [Euryarchaeota archaeon]